MHLARCSASQAGGPLLPCCPAPLPAHSTNSCAQMKCSPTVESHCRLKTAFKIDRNSGYIYKKEGHMSQHRQRHDQRNILSPMLDLVTVALIY